MINMLKDSDIEAVSGGIFPPISPLIVPVIVKAVATVLAGEAAPSSDSE